MLNCNQTMPGRGSRQGREAGKKVNWLLLIYKQKEREREKEGAEKMRFEFKD